ncbi:MAG: DUF916 domain-containing protein [Actinomyces sp.]|nr:MAG: DUF916 domain-containing protein [Actinomyces sp.]
MIRRLIAAVAVVAAVVAAAPAAFAASTDQWAVEPSGPDGPGGRAFFVYSLAPGQVFQDTVGVSNYSDRTITFDLFAVDAFTVPGEGGFAPIADDQESVDAGTWVELPVDQITIEPGTRADIPFQVAVPLDATPGDHAAVLLAADHEFGFQDGEGFTVAVRQRVGARIYVRVAGPLDPALRVDDIAVEHATGLNPFAGSTATVTYQISNVGNVRLSPELTLEVTGLFGRTVRSVPTRTIPDILPGGVVRVTETIDDLTTWEPLAARLVIESPEFSTTSSTTFYPIPWPSLALLVLVTGIAGVWFSLRRRRRRPDTPAPDEPAAITAGAP